MQVIFYNYLMGPTPKDTSCRPCQSIFMCLCPGLIKRMSCMALDLMGAGLAGLFHRCAFHLEPIHSAYSGLQCTWKVSDYICCLRLLCLASMDAPHYWRQTDPSPPVDTRDSQQVCHAYANIICIHDAIKQEIQTICFHIFQVGVRRLVNWLTNSHGLGLRDFSRWRNLQSVLICRNHLEISPGHTVGCH